MKATVDCVGGWSISLASLTGQYLSGHSGRKNVLRKLLRILHRRLKAGFSVC